MVSIHPIPILMSLTFLLSVLRLTYSIETARTIITTEEPTISSAVFQQTYEIARDYSNTEAVINVTIPFMNGICTNPIVAIYREAGDFGSDDEFLDFFYGEFNQTENLLIRCRDAPDEEAEECDAFWLCGQFELPVGDYTELELFIYQPNTVSAGCGNGQDGEEGPLRSLRVRFTVSCQAEIECGEEEEAESVEDEDESGSSSESGEAAIRIENERLDHEVEYMEPKQMEENIPVRIDCNSYFNFLMMIVLCICLCWIAQCALFYQYRNK